MKKRLYIEVVLVISEVKYLLDLDLKAAIMDVEIAKSNFDNAKNKESIDMAIYQLMEAEEKLNLLIQERKNKKLTK